MKKKAHFMPAWVSAWCLRFWGVRVDIANKEAIDPNQNYIIVTNHSSDLDPFLTSFIFRKLYAKYLAKAEILKYPIFGMALRNMYIPVSRGSRNSREESMRTMIQTIRTEQCSLFIYPEGTRNKGPELLREFHDGAFKIAIETQIPILVATLTNSFFIMKPKSWLLHPQRLRVYVEDPIPTIGLQSGDAAMLREEVRKRMLAAYAKENITELL